MNLIDKYTPLNPALVTRLTAKCTSCIYIAGVPSTFIDALEDLAEEWDKEYVCYISCYVLTTDMDHLKQQ